MRRIIIVAIALLIASGAAAQSVGNTYFVCIQGNTDYPKDIKLLFVVCSKQNSEEKYVCEKNSWTSVLGHGNKEKGEYITRFLGDSIDGKKNLDVKCYVFYGTSGLSKKPTLVSPIAWGIQDTERGCDSAHTWHFEQKKGRLELKLGCNPGYPCR